MKTTYFGGLKNEKQRKPNNSPKTGIANRAKALEHGKSKTLTACLVAMATFHRYSFGNVKLTLIQIK